MRLITLPVWCGGLWVAAGVQMACGGGMPGPVFLVAVAAGLWAGLPAGLAIGALAGLCDAALCQHAILPVTLLAMLGGAAASVLPCWLARNHLLVAMLAAFCTSFLAGLCLAIPGGSPPSAVLFATLRHAGENALWMIPIYGIVLVISLRCSPPLPRGE